MTKENKKKSPCDTCRWNLAGTCMRFDRPTNDVIGCTGVGVAHGAVKGAGKPTD